MWPFRGRNFTKGSFTPSWECKIMFKLQFLYLVRRSVETTYYTVSRHCSSRPANIGFTWGLALPKRCLFRFQSCGIWLYVEGLKSNNFSEKLTALHCYVSTATEQRLHLNWLQQRGECPFKIQAAMISRQSQISVEKSVLQTQLITSPLQRSKA
jgi:hypothetical protein